MARRDSTTIVALTMLEVAACHRPPERPVIDDPHEPRGHRAECDSTAFSSPRHGIVHDDVATLPEGALLPAGFVDWHREVVVDITESSRRQCNVYHPAVRAAVRDASTPSGAAGEASPEIERRTAGFFVETRRDRVVLEYIWPVCPPGNPDSCGSGRPNTTCFIVVPRPPRGVEIEIEWTTIPCTATPM